MLLGVPCEMVDCFDSSRPILLGGLGPGEDRQGCMKLRLKKHRWFPKILKARDPLVFSVGWRRFQSLPIFAVEDHNRRIRMLKYTPEHSHCIAAMWGTEHLAPIKRTTCEIVSITAWDIGFCVKRGKKNCVNLFIRSNFTSQQWICRCARPVLKHTELESVCHWNYS